MAACGNFLEMVKMEGLICSAGGNRFDLSHNNQLSAELREQHGHCC